METSTHVLRTTMYGRKGAEVCVGVDEKDAGFRGGGQGGGEALGRGGVGGRIKTSAIASFIPREKKCLKIWSKGGRGGWRRQKDGWMGWRNGIRDVGRDRRGIGWGLDDGVVPFG